MDAYGTSELVNGEAIIGSALGSGANGHAVATGPHAAPIVIVHRGALERECLARSLEANEPSLVVAPVGCFDEAKAVARKSAPAAILLIRGDWAAADQAGQTELQKFISGFDGVAVIVVADSDGPTDILAALDGGAKGYVSTNASVKVLARAIGLACSGGTFVPASCILGLRSAIQTTQDNGGPSSEMFTTRQIAVANSLRQGKANKIIAYELNMCESTVKVHVRNIMKKLGATNRTQVAYKLTEMAA